MAKVFITQAFPGDGAERIREAGHELAVRPQSGPIGRDEMLVGVRGCAGLISQLTDRVDAEVMDAAGEGLRVISNYAAGVNNIDIPEATGRRIVVCNTPGVLSEATADIAWTLMLGIARRAAEGDRLVRSGAWTGWKPQELLGADLVGRTLAIVGAGRIGHCVARRARGWRMPVVYVARHRHEPFERDFNAPRVELDEALAMADFVSLHLPLTDQTHHLIDARRLALMKPTAYLINTGRGPVVDEAALMAALQEGRLKGAALDVFQTEPLPPEHPFWGMETVIVTPHCSAVFDGWAERSVAMFAENLARYRRGEALHNVVDPERGY
jgi:glyoxylate reductase